MKHWMAYTHLAHDFKNFLKKYHLVKRDVQMDLWQSNTAGYPVLKEIILFLGRQPAHFC